MANPKDEVYSRPMPSIEAFRFDQSVADVFQDMIERSVPGYGLVLQLIGVLAEKYGQPGTQAYDLGCSLGASTLQLRRHLPDDCHVIGAQIRGCCCHQPPALWVGLHHRTGLVPHLLQSVWTHQGFSVIQVVSKPH